jgi:hypothetical protein
MLLLLPVGHHSLTSDGIPQRLLDFANFWASNSRLVPAGFACRSHFLDSLIFVTLTRCFPILTPGNTANSFL